MTRDEVMALLNRLATFAAVMKASEIVAARDSVSALYAERDALLTVREVLRRECAALKAERSELIDDVEAMQQTNNDLAEENGRLRDALERLIAAANDSDDALYGTIGSGYVRDIARVALNATEKEQHGAHSASIATGEGNHE